MQRDGGRGQDQGAPRGVPGGGEVAAEDHPAGRRLKPDDPARVHDGGKDPVHPRAEEQRLWILFV